MRATACLIAPTPRQGSSMPAHLSLVVKTGIAKDASFRAQREELSRFAHVIFSGQPGDRAYWLGQHADFAANGLNPKPCLHGSDAHALDAVLSPTQDRRCWIRGEPTFDGLRQTLVEPERRVHIGEAPPQGPHAADAIHILRFRRAHWIDNQDIALNDGLVAIIGAKGSGKTALADCFKFRNKIGLDVALEALREAHRAKKASADELWATPS